MSEYAADANDEHKTRQVITLRVSRELHLLIRRAANQSDQSMNQFCIELLQAEVGIPRYEKNIRTEM